MTDAEVVAAIRRQHLKANINDPFIVSQDWDAATVDAGGTVFGAGPYVKLPVEFRTTHFTFRDGICEKAHEGRDTAVIRVYAPERLRRRLARDWRPDRG